jgi:hypothetical protein
MSHRHHKNNNFKNKEIAMRDADVKALYKQVIDRLTPFSGGLESQQLHSNEQRAHTALKAVIQTLQGKHDSTYEDDRTVETLQAYIVNIDILKNTKVPVFAGLGEKPSEIFSDQIPTLVADLRGYVQAATAKAAAQEAAGQQSGAGESKAQQRLDQLLALLASFVDQPGVKLPPGAQKKLAAFLPAPPPKNYDPIPDKYETLTPPGVSQRPLWLTQDTKGVSNRVHYDRWKILESVSPAVYVAVMELCELRSTLLSPAASQGPATASSASNAMFGATDAGATESQLEVTPVLQNKLDVIDKVIYSFLRESMVESSAYHDMGWSERVDAVVDKAIPGKEQVSDELTALLDGIKKYNHVDVLPEDDLATRQQTMRKPVKPGTGYVLPPNNGFYIELGGQVSAASAPTSGEAHTGDATAMGQTGGNPVHLGGQVPAASAPTSGEADTADATATGQTGENPVHNGGLRAPGT